MKLRGEELVKFLQDVLDSLFAMFSTDDGNSTSHSGLVFEVLVRIVLLIYYAGYGRNSSFVNLCNIYIFSLIGTYFKFT